jgi:membrane-bound lytic murein transglycosylase D
LAEQRAGRFPLPETLKPQVNFWKAIFTRYTTRQVVLHDDWYLDVVYGVVDLDRSVVAGETGWQAVAAAKDRLRDLLKGMDGKWDAPETMTAEEKTVFALFQKPPASARFPKRDAHKRVRGQVGQADRIRRGIGFSGRYMSAIRRIFADAGLPEELVCLPLIESGFNPHARSHAGAAGMWQFMPATGKRFGLMVGDLVDERLDPIRAARAAAGLLGHNYRTIGSWPLAITAYNHGLGGMQNAVKAVGSDRIDAIVQEYDGPRFSFSSRNFYVEFLAAVDVYTGYQFYFGDLDWHPPWETAAVTLDHYVTASTLAQYCGLDVETLRQLNPALRPRIFQSGAAIPRTYRLNLVPGDRERFLADYKTIPAELKLARLPAGKVHRVRRRQTLSHIAAHYNTSVRALMQANGIRNPSRIMAGQLLRIPEG